MRTIIYGVAGEGLGHSVRAKSLATQLLKKNIQIIFLVGKNSSKVLKGEFLGHPNVSFIDIPILEFYFDNTGKINLFKTLRKSLSYFLDKKNECKKIINKVKHADLVISDYEPISANLGKMLNVDIITIDSQHIYDYASFFTVPFYRWLNFLSIRFSTYIFCSKRKYSIIVHFNKEEKPRNNYFENSFIVGPFIREEILHSKKYDGDHILVYVHESVGEQVIDALKEYNDFAIIYGLGRRKSHNHGRIQYKEISQESFIEDLVSAKRVICTAGTTLPGECLFLGKNFFVIPIPNQIEQEFNVYFLEKMGVPSAGNSSKKIYEKTKQYLYGEFGESNFKPLDSGVFEAEKIIMHILEKRK